MNNYPYFFSFFAKRDNEFVPGSIYKNLSYKISDFNELEHIVEEIEEKFNYDQGSVIIMNFQIF